MINMNFVPEDYIRNSEFRRTNLFYLVLFVVVMVALSGSFATIKMRQRALDEKERIVNEKMIQTKEAIKQFEQLQEKRRVMMKTALVTADLLESVPRSVLLASLTNNLPSGVSLLQLKLVQRKPKNSTARHKTASASKYQSLQAQNAARQVSQEKLLETHIDIEGIAPSNLEVASYIKKLSNSTLLDNVTLVESKEQKIDDMVFRQFKLTAMLKKDISLISEDVEKIKHPV
ncbi:MAG: PilN domain-containing protein [Planctomycetes bacterium]|nr:PilN domain-containing protein [Planctomycetota bacterium]